MVIYQFTKKDKIILLLILHYDIYIKVGLELENMWYYFNTSIHEHSFVTRNQKQSKMPKLSFAK